MNIIKKIVIGVAGLVALFVAVGFFLPRTAHVERATTIEAPAAMVFTVLNGFRQFDRWSPWAGIDPNAKTTHEGPESGVGAKMNWAGNAEVGTGSQEVIESTPDSQIRVRLTFGDFPGSFEASYTLAPAAAGTRVTWAFDADYGSSLVGRYFGLLSDRMIGPDYEKGLAQLKAFVESMPRADFSGLRMETVNAVPVPVVMTSTSSPRDARAIGVALGVAYSRLSGYMTARGLRQAAAPIAIFHGESNGSLRMDAAIPVDRTDAESDGPIRAGRTFAGRAVKAVYRGPYAGLGAANEQVRAYLVAAGLKQAGPSWEQYLSDPGTTPQDELITHIYYPIQ